MTRRFELIRQPPNSRICGQAVLAMVLGISLDEACERIGHRHGTKTRELINALRKGGVACPDRVSLVIHESFPEVCICKATKKGRRNWHWMLKYRRTILDPGVGWEVYACNGWEITSFLPIHDAWFGDSTSATAEGA